MTIAMLVDNPAGSRELYERILDNLDHDLPLGTPRVPCSWPRGRTGPPR